MQLNREQRRAAHKTHAVLVRKTKRQRHHVDPRAGLVKEAPKGMFQRVPVDAKVESLLEKQSETQDKQPDNTEVMTKPKNQAAPIEKISKLTEKCKSILEMLKELSSDIETVAIEVQESFSDQGKDAEKLRQLQLLLKSIG